MLGHATLALAGAVLLSVAPVGDDGLTCGITRTPSVVRIRNDLPVKVQLHLCKSNDCHDVYDDDSYAPAPGREDVVGVSSIGVPNVYLVQTVDGRRLGCLPLVSPHLRKTEIEVRVSEAVPCREHIDQDAFWPARWARMS